MPTPHKHAELIKKWADGAQIQFFSIKKQWEESRAFIKWIGPWQTHMEEE